MHRRMLPAAGLLLVLVAGCSSASMQLEPTHTLAPTNAASPANGMREVIWIQMPGPGSRVVNPLQVRGEGDPVFEQTLVARLVSAEGSVLTQQPVTIQAPLGERGVFETTIPFEVEADTSALLQVFSVSARDGGIEHLNSVGVILSAQGPEQLTTLDHEEERLVILSPAPGSDIPGGRLVVTGRGIASFEGTLLLSLLDAAGNVLAEEILTIAAPEMGQPGDFRVELTFSVAERQPGRLVLMDPLPVFDGIGHVASVPVVLLP